MLVAQVQNSKFAAEVGLQMGASRRQYPSTTVVVRYGDQGLKKVMHCNVRLLV